MNKEIKFDAKKIMQFDFNVDTLENVINIHTYEETFFDIPIDSFWQWIKDNGLNDYCNDYYDASRPDNHGQDTGSLSRLEYLDLSHETIKKDLIHYITQSKFKKYF